MAWYQPSFSFRRCARGPLAKQSEVEKNGVAASLGFRVPVVHDLASARAGSASVHVVPPPHPDEREAGAASRALHVWREQVIPHREIWHRFTPSRLWKFQR